jgi:uncharacterized glyoxalase superfamily protein PhnB
MRYSDASAAIEFLKRAFGFHEDPDAHCRRARAAGAEVMTELHNTDYGSRDYAARDLEGNVWSFGTYRPAVEQR